MAAGTAMAGPAIAPTLAGIAPLGEGDAAPPFTALKADGSIYEFRPDAQERPLLVVFYRGGWCGACNQQLRDLAAVMPDIAALDVDVVFPNGDRPEILYSSLMPETKAAIDGMNYLLVSDSDLEAASAFGIAYVLADDVLARYRSRDHWDLEESSIDHHDALPLPSIFLVGRDGRIEFEYHDPDPRVRLPADELLATIRQRLSD
jgi:peroxiredoxin